MSQIFPKTEPADETHQSPHRRKTIQGKFYILTKYSFFLMFECVLIFYFLFSQCTVCSRRFTQKGSLQIHMSQHDGLRPHACNFCSARFSQKGGLFKNDVEFYFILGSSFEQKYFSNIFEDIRAFWVQ